jgi:uracil-DNA glycosylase family 4
MALTERHKQYLSLMDIQPWEPRSVSIPTAEPRHVEPVSEQRREKQRRDEQRQDTSSVQSLSQPQTIPAGPSVAGMNWDQLRNSVLHCQQCELYQTRTQAVFGVGNQQARWMVIGEAPGVDEDRQGEPFVGRAGQLLNNMLYAIGLQREMVYIANVLKCRPPNNRDPRPEEVLRCEAYLKRQVALIQPKIILAVGRIAAHNLLKTDSSLAKLRGKTFYYGDTETPLIVTYHPAYLLRSPGEKRKAWQDLQYAVSVFRQQIQAKVTT